MVHKSCVGKKIIRFLTYKTCGVAALAFCIGTIAGMCFPITFIAFLEAVVLLVLAWLCLFHW